MGRTGSRVEAHPAADIPARTGCSARIAADKLSTESEAVVRAERQPQGLDMCSIGSWVDAHTAAGIPAGTRCSAHIAADQLRAESEAACVCGPAAAGA